MAGSLFTINGISGWKLVEMIAGSETLGFLSLDARFPVTLRLLTVPEPLRSPWSEFSKASATTPAAGGAKARQRLCEAKSGILPFS